MIRSLNRPLAFALAVAGLAALACNSDRAIVTEPLSAAYNFRFATAGSNIPRGTVTQYNATTATPDSFVVRLQGLEQLATGVYQVFLGAQPCGHCPVSSYSPATGTLRVIHTDTTIVNDDPVVTPDTTIVPNVSSFTNGGPRTRVELVVNSVTLAQDPGIFNMVLVTIEPAAATTPGADSPKPLWARFFFASGATRTQNLTFGNFHHDPVSEYRYGVGGRGTISAWNDVLVIDDSALALPPKGYYYATVVTRDIEVATNTFELDTILLGPQKAPYPRRNVSLLNADIDPNLDPVVLEFPPSILGASERIRLDTLNIVGHADQPFRFYRAVHVTLEAKAGIPEASPSVILTATFPDNIARPPAD